MIQHGNFHLLIAMSSEIEFGRLLQSKGRKLRDPTVN